jgi:hypothetical protein
LKQIATTHSLWTESIDLILLKLLSLLRLLFFFFSFFPPRIRMSFGVQSPLLSLPVEMLRCILHYLPLNDIGALDNASTNLSGRERYLLAIDRFEIEKISSTSKVIFDSQIRWCHSRGIVFNSLLDYIARLQDHPCLPDLIRRSQNTICSIDWTNINFTNNTNTCEIMSALRTCPNIRFCTMMLCNITGRDFTSCLNNKTKLLYLSLYSLPQLTSASIRSIPIYCPNLCSIVFSDIPSVSDQELSAIITGCRSLEDLKLSNVNITDQSMRLLMETNLEKDIVTWDFCPGVTWEGKFIYVRELSLVLLFSQDVNKQTRGIKHISSMTRTNFLSPFPIEQFISIGVFHCIQSLVLRLNLESSTSQHTLLDNILNFLFQLTWTTQCRRNVSVLIESGFMDVVMAMVNHFTIVSDTNHSLEWLKVMEKISEDSTFHHYLFSARILSKLKTLGQVSIRSLTDPLLKHDKLSAYQATLSICDIIQIFANLSTNISDRVEEWIQIIPFLVDLRGLEVEHQREVKANANALKIVKMIATNIAQPLHLHLLLENDIKFTTYLGGALQQDTSVVEMREGLRLMVRFQSIDPSFTSMENLQWLRRTVEELQDSENEDVASLSKQLLFAWETE